MSRIPAAAPAGAAAPSYRLNMIRRAPTAAPAATTARPRVVKAKASGQAVRKARPVRKASVRRDARKSAPVARRAAPAVLAAPARIPTLMPVAERELATPLSYALITTTVCEARGAAPAAADAGIPVLAIAPSGDGPGFTGGDDFPPDGPGGPGVLFPQTLPPGGDNPIVILPPLGPPIGPPGVPPVTTPVPEPGTWALMIAGFGLLGARLRVRRRASATSSYPGRAGPLE